MGKTRGRQSGRGTIDMLAQTTGTVERVKLVDIDAAFHPWEVRRSAPSGDVADLCRAATMRGIREPLRVVPHDSTPYAIVTGRLAFEAARQHQAEGGPDWVMAEVLPSTSTEDLLRKALVASQLKFRCTTIEFGWGLARLEGLLKAQDAHAPLAQEGRAAPKKRLARNGDAVRHRHLADALGLDYGRFKSRISEGLSAAGTLPEVEAVALSERCGLQLTDFAALKRPVWRLLTAAPAELVPELRQSIAESLKHNIPVLAVLESVLERHDSDRGPRRTKAARCASRADLRGAIESAESSSRLSLASGKAPEAVAQTTATNGATSVTQDVEEAVNSEQPAATTPMQDGTEEARHGATPSPESDGESTTKDSAERPGITGPRWRKVVAACVAALTSFGSRVAGWVTRLRAMAFNLAARRGGGSPGDPKSSPGELPSGPATVRTQDNARPSGEQPQLGYAEPPSAGGALSSTEQRR